jgi:modification methylase
MGKRTGRRRRPEPAAAAPAAPTTAWATGQHDPATDLIERGYHIDTAADTTRIPPAIAEYAINAYSPPGATVLDPDCGAGSVVVEALRAGRHAIGLATTRSWRNLASANVNAVRANGAATDAMVLVLARRAHTLPTARAAGLTGRVDLVLTALRPAPDPDSAVATLRSLLTEIRPLLRPGGHVVTVVDPRVWPHGRDGQLGALINAGGATGLVPVERCVALTGRLARGKVVDRARRSERRASARRSRDLGHPVAIAAHRDVVVFREATADAGEVAGPPVRGKHSHHHSRVAAGLAAARAA